MKTRHPVGLFLGIGASMAFTPGVLWTQDIVYPRPTSSPVIVTAAGISGTVRSTAPGAVGVEALLTLLRPGPFARDSVYRSEMTGADGRFHWESLPPGPFILHVRALAHENLRIPIQVEPAGRDSLVIRLRPAAFRLADLCNEDCEAKPAGTLAGRVRCRDDKRALPPGLIAEVRIQEWGAVYLNTQDTVRGRGRFTFEGLPYDDWVVGVRDSVRDLAVLRVHHRPGGTKSLILVVPCSQ